MNKKREEMYICIGINKDGALIMLDSIFDHGSMCGAVGSEFYALTQDQVDERNDVEYIEDVYDIEHFWKEAVANGETNDSYEDFRDSWLLNSDGEFFGHDDSYIRHIPESIKKEHFPNAVTFECVGGGRMFPQALEDLVTVLRPDLVQRIKDIESKDENRAKAE